MVAEPSSEIRMQTMFLCMPLRLGVLVMAMLTLLFSIFYCTDRAHFEYELRYFVGGYGLKSRVAIGLVEVTGVVFGMVGILGVWYQKTDYVQTFNLWQGARLVAWMYMFFVDIPLITHCEDWVNNVKATTEALGWNQLMYEVAIDGRCEAERSSFAAYSFMTLLVFMYIAWCTHRLQDFMSRAPKHLLRVPKDLSSGVFYADSMGERKFLNGPYAAPDQPEYGAGGMPPPSWAMPPQMGMGGMPA